MFRFRAAPASSAPASQMTRRKLFYLQQDTLINHKYSKILKQDHVNFQFYFKSLYSERTQSSERKPPHLLDEETDPETANSPEKPPRLSF